VTRPNPFLSVHAYLRGPESLRRRELVHGVVREPAAPLTHHQLVVTRLAGQLEWHAGPEGLGWVLVSPIDVILDADQALVVQPDIVFVSAERASILQDQIWGAPDLVVEVLSTATARRDRTTKLGWYDRYGVRECWLVDPVKRRIEVHGFGPVRGVHACDSRGALHSNVLPELNAPLADLFRRMPAPRVCRAFRRRRSPTTGSR
jgi:Uma2 family endonuclease